MSAHWTQVGMFWATLVVAAIAIVATIVNYWIFRVQIEPHVIVYTRSDESRPSIILLVVQNIGKGMAHKVRFEFSRPIPGRAFGLSESSAEAPVPLESGPLVTGIPSLGPGSSRVLVWGQFGGLSKALGLEPVLVRCHFQGKRPDRFDPTSLVSESYLEVRSYEGTDAVDTDGSRQSAKQLKRIADQLDQLAKRI